MATFWWSIDLQEAPERIAEKFGRAQRANRVLGRFGIDVQEKHLPLSSFLDFTADIPGEKAAAILQALWQVMVEPTAADCDTPEELALIEPLFPAARIR